MNFHVRWLAPLVLVALLGCNSDSGGTPFKGPVGNGSEECAKYVAWTSPLSSSCTACLHEQCAPAWQSMSQVCQGEPSARCVGDGGSMPASNFCTCMVGLPQGCGTALANVYACFVNECGSSCGAGGAGGSAGSSGKGGSAGKAGSSGAAGKAGSGGSGGIPYDSGAHDGI
jgi:hypothetical protein